MNNKSSKHFHIKWASTDWELEQARRIRNAVFCEEQEIFNGHDIDEIDGVAKTLVAVTHVAGMPEKVAGTVRIHEISPRQWYGSRLAVDKKFRREGVLGAALIELAVRSATTLGCDEFHATVQRKNERFFAKMHWDKTSECMAFGIPHVSMLADLNHYPAMSDAQNGFWVEGKQLRLDMNVLDQFNHYWVGNEYGFDTSITH
ncbi:MSMEG_0567/Sll0786 family nitrogen starvation N-acetyltransferase [Vibrio sp. SCSIO 43169]|uniref:MSMEG_0567/Sll0786 family nitrogen starvation N-acetyltransferase n=1 Tax=Vibrio sp. SCSIO 43169 TaxID=2822801 RepID=UPI002043CF16|nr:MSMEG_0567/Sll0786 family nitrogen starvation N-acetyltransferase [Vibrio sp. SCSIO 43169]MCM5511048.1 GNAT family N-acetyltransferase [Vibrio sp. SCSIO 43169]